MKLAIIPEGPLAFDGRNYLYSEGEALYIDSIAKYFDEVIICAYVFHKGDSYYEAVARSCFKASNIRVLELPLFYQDEPNNRRNAKYGKLSKFYQLFLVARIVLVNIKDWDLLYIFLPGYPGAITSLINKLFNRPYITYLACDWSELSSILIPWQGFFKKLVGPLYYRFVNWAQNTTVKNSLFVLCAGGLLAEKYKDYKVPVVETVPRLNWPDFKVFPREDTCKAEPIRLLFVGYLIPRKGAVYLIEAFSLLRRRGELDVSLTIVGAGEQMNELNKLASKLGIHDRVEFLGHIPNGPGLIDIYRESDIFVLPTSGEGFPRVLYEAMSQAIPVVTTNVSGIPYKMKHEENALLVPPGDPEAIASAVERLIDDEALRRILIANGRKFMETMLEECDGGKQVHTLLKEHNVKYRHWIESGNY
jgi:glycosyltransferase involved in cell wall biosynthesis